MPAATRTYVSQHTRQQARVHGVTVAPSQFRSKKLDVFNASGHLIASIGTPGGADYAQLAWMEKQGKLTPGTADKRREEYHKVFGARATQGSNLWWTIKLLW